MSTSVALGPHFEAFIHAQIASGRYNNISEVMRDALRLMEEREETRRIKREQLKLALAEGMQSGAGHNAEEVLDRLEAKYTAMTPAKKSH